LPRQRRRQSDFFTIQAGICSVRANLRRRAAPRVNTLHIGNRQLLQGLAGCIGGGKLSTRGEAMAFPTAVNDQITDSVTQANVKVLGDAPAIAMGNLYQATAQALANAAHNAANAQQQSYVTSQAATTMGVATLYSLDTAATGVATKDILTPSVRGL